MLQRIQYALLLFIPSLLGRPIKCFTSKQTRSNKKWSYFLFADDSKTNADYSRCKARHRSLIVRASHAPPAEGAELGSRLCTATYPKQNSRTANPTGSSISGGLGSLSGSDKLP